MAWASLTRTGNLNRAFAGAIAPDAGTGGSLLTQYALRLGDTLLRHRAELAERAARIEAELASQVKSDFIANISHELRTPLNSILGFAKMLKAAETTPLEPAQVSEYAGFILDSADNLLGIVNDVIMISKLQSGKLTAEIDETDAGEILRPCAAWAETRAGETKHKFIARIDDNMPAVLADTEYFKDVVMRLLANAFIFTPENGTVALTAKPTSDRRALICVSDNGIGMTADETAIALTAFGQIDNRLDRQHEGTGLGLPIAKALTELQGGSFIVRSEKGKGTDIILLFGLSPGASSPGAAEGMHA